VDATERLLERAREYEFLAAWCSERAGFSADHATSAVAFTVAAILLREVAGALEEEPWAA
jgi:hypothetical protein